MKKAFVKEAKEDKTPKVTWEVTCLKRCCARNVIVGAGSTHEGWDFAQMKIAGFFRWFFEALVSKRTAVVSKRLKGYACYDDVFNALLYWNNKDDIIPNSLSKYRSRSHYDIR